jgi:hypothetical protein
MLQRFTHFTLVVTLLGGLCVGCVDPEGDYEEFQERDKKTTGIKGEGCGVSDPDGGDAAPPCNPTSASALQGQWLFALAATLGPDKPILFFADVVATDVADGVEWTWTITPLDAKTRTPLTALPTLAPSVVPSSGAWTVDLAPIAVPGAANPITGSDIEADANLAGNVCGGRDFFCGDVTGNVTKPVSLKLDGSKWTMAKLPAPDTLPETIFVSCECEPAAPPAQ